MCKIALSRGIAAVLIWTLSRASFAQQIPRMVHVRLTDMAGLPDGIETRAESIVEMVFRKAGVELDFAGAAEKVDFRIQIMKRRPVTLHGDTTGFAVLVRSERSSDSYAAISWPVVEAVSRELDAPAVEVLAASIAHELGHLLLHSPGHSLNGIMRSRLDRKQIELLERGEFRFTKEEAARMVEQAGRLAPK